MNAPRLSPRSAARLSAGMLFAAGGYAGLAGLVMLIVRYSPLAWRLPGEVLFPLQIALAAHVAATVLLIPAAWRFRRMSTAATIWPRLLVATLAIGFIGSLDLIVGVFYPPAVGKNSLLDRHIERGWTNRPNAYGPSLDTFMRFDKHGLRVSADEPAPDPAGRTRILFVGDSLTLGYRCRAREAFPWQTAGILNERCPGFDFAALNGGVSGYDTTQEADWFEKVGPSLSPDLVVLQFCLNDVTEQFDPSQHPSCDPHAEASLAKRPRNWSGIQRAIFDIRRRMQYGSDLEAAARKIEQFQLEEVLNPDPPEHVTRAWACVFDAIDRFRSAAERHDTPMLFVIFPIIHQLEDDTLPGLAQLKLRAFAESKGIACLDLLPVYRREIEAGATAHELFTDPTHPTARGHRVAAEAIADFIMRCGVLRSISATMQMACETH